MFITRLFSSFLDDPKALITVFLLALPGRLLAISAHESAHGWVAWRCGDPTAKNLGRITLNPLKHIDPIGIVCLLLLGFGWARPVPVNPRNYRDPRRDDLKVSLAGITMNLILFLAGIVAMYAFLGLAFARIPAIDSTAELTALPDTFRTSVRGVAALAVEGGDGWYRAIDLLQYPYAAWELVVVPAFGTVGGALYRMLYYFVAVNLVLAVFNLIPIPPLDGYHVLNDLVLRRNLFASGRTQIVSMVFMVILVTTDVVDKVLSWVQTQVFSGFGSAVMRLLSGLFQG